MRIWSFAASLALGLLLVGCGAQQAQQPAETPAQLQPKYGGTLYLANNTDPPDLDALWGVSAGVTYMLSPSYNSLIVVDPYDNTKIVPDLAEKWDLSADGKTYTFYLNKKAKWQDGKPVIARDVKLFFDSKMQPPKGVCCPAGKTRDSFLTDLIEEVRVVDDATISVRMNRPSREFLFVIGLVRRPVVPAHIAAEKVSMENTVLGSGPFKFVSYTRGTNYKVTKNPEYWREGLPYIENIEYFILPDPSTRFAAFRAGKIDVTSISLVSMSDTQAATVEKEMADRAKVVWEDAVENAGLGFNMSKPPFNDVRVRTAVHLAVDRQRAIKTLAEGGRAEIGTHLPRVKGLTRYGKELENTPGYRQPKDQDIAEAKRLLDEAGYKAGPDGKRMSIRTTARSDPGFEKYIDVNVFFKEEMAKIGIEVNIIPIGDNDLPNLKRRNEWEVEGRTRAGFWASPVSSSNYWLGEGAYGERPRNPEINKAYADYDSNLDPSKDKELLSRLDELLEKELPYSFWYWKDYPMGIMNYVQNFKPCKSYSACNRWEAAWLNK